jgi:hypothetical protein
MRADPIRAIKDEQIDALEAGDDRPVDEIEDPQSREVVAEALRLQDLARRQFRAPARDPGPAKPAGPSSTEDL